VELYKYCRETHLRSLEENGALRLGTLSDYRKTDRYGELTADEREGTKKLGGSIVELNAHNAHMYPGLAGLIKVKGEGKFRQLTVKNSTVQSRDLLVFSTSARYSEEAHKKWLESEGYDACYRITSARLFFRAVTEALGPQYGFLGFGRVIYAEEFDIAAIQAAVHPALVKRHSRYIEQDEVRTLWKPTDGKNVEPVLLDASSANLYVVRHRVLAKTEA
jgi:hypothetical protein